MSVFVELQLPAGESRTVGPGAIIGRSFVADIRLEDGRVAEAHALVSLHGGDFVLLALGGQVRVRGRVTPRVTLVPGLSFELPGDLSLSVTTVHRPTDLLALEGPGVHRRVLAGVLSVCTRPRLQLVTGVRANAAAIVFSDGLSWFVREKGTKARRVRAGDELLVGDRTLRFVTHALADAGRADHGHTGPPGGLRLFHRGASVHLWAPGAHAPTVISGQPAALLARLLAHRGPLRWEAAAHALWPRAAPDDVVRHRLDVVLGKLRRRLDEAGLRRDLVTAHRNGFLELVLYPGDQAHEHHAVPGGEAR